ncbi:pyocin knob domain-containing protein [Levilactobacillus brevis]|uniref:pyocin knob domain-containing protein n=1 Tax=Levilactobacillus brevis TaxID=1580 RepID=UPI0021A73729|nr:pyocin knob domain-containing protein [Levilactobacillus brevis]MCT3597561.1 hypothetical protein [Levilactobacillus brevis]
MADSSRTIMTDAGFALETRVRADETKMQFTRAAISTDDHFSDTDDALAKLTELYNIQQDGKVTAVQVINTTTVYVQVDVNQAESKADYQMRSAALYAKDDDGTEVLYGVTVLQDPVFVHKDADGSYLGFGINTTVGKASNVVVVVDPANMVTQQVFEGTMKNYYTKAEVDAKFVTDDDFASKLPKNIATTDAANTFAKSQTLAGGATDGKGNAYATTKDVATGLKNGFNTKVNVSDMRKPASDVAGIEEVNAKQDKIGYTPADDSKVVHSTVTQLNSTDMDNVITAGFYQLNSGTNGMPNADQWTIYQVIPLSSANGVQIAYETSKTVLGMRSWEYTKSGLTFSSWIQFADDSKVVHSTDMRKPANQVASIDEVNAKQDKLDYTPANAANVVHRNPDTGVVSEPTDFTNLTVEGGKSVATRDDLKSVIDNSWLPIKIADGWTSTPVLMKYDKTNGKTIITGMMSKPFGVSDGTCTEALLTLPDGFYWNEVDNSMIGINQANILEATINPDNKKELIVSYKWKWSSPASGNAFVGYNEAYSIGSDEKVTGTYYETTSISQA